MPNLSLVACTNSSSGTRSFSLRTAHSTQRKRAVLAIHGPSALSPRTSISFTISSFHQVHASIVKGSPSFVARGVQKRNAKPWWVIIEAPQTFSHGLFSPTQESTYVRILILSIRNAHAVNLRP